MKKEFVRMAKGFAILMVTITWFVDKHERKNCALHTALCSVSNMSSGIRRRVLISHKKQSS
jgi:hypothetical protein